MSGGMQGASILAGLGQGLDKGAQNFANLYMHKKASDLYKERTGAMDFRTLMAHVYKYYSDPRYSGNLQPQGAGPGTPIPGGGTQMGTLSVPGQPVPVGAPGQLPPPQAGAAPIAQPPPDLQAASNAEENPVIDE